MTTANPELVASDGQETIVCEVCDETIIQGNSIVLKDICERCEIECAAGRLLTNGLFAVIETPDGRVRSFDPRLPIPFVLSTSRAVT